MADYIQTLELQISDNARHAESDLDKLAASLRKIKATIAGGINLRGITTELGQFAGKMRAVGSKDNLASLNKLANAIGRLVTNAKELKTVSQSLAAVNRALENSAGAVAGGNYTRHRRNPTGRHEAAAAVADAAEYVRHRRNPTGRHEAIEAAPEYVRHRRNPVGRHEAVEEAPEYVRHRRAYSGRHEAGYFQAQEQAREAQQAAEAARQAMAMIEQLTKTADGLLERGWISKEGRDALVGRLNSGELPVDRFDVYKSDNGQLDYIRAVEAVLRSIREINSEIVKEADVVTDEIEDSKEQADGMNAALQNVRDTAKEVKNEVPWTVETPRERHAPDPEAIAQMRLERLARVASPEQRRTDIDARAAGRVAELREEIDQYAESTARATGAEYQRASAMMDAAAAARDDASSIRDVNDAQTAVAESVTDGAGALSEAAAEQEEAAEAAGEHAGVLDMLRAAVNRLHDAVNAFTHSGLGRMIHSFTRTARSRIFRYLIREIAQGFRTGLDNVREYSKAIDGLYSRDMAGLDNTLLKMKNSLGAALAPAIRALIPLFQTLANWVITVSNYVNQFFAMLTGQSTWTRAVEVDAAALEDEANAANKAAKANKNLLASWDELNIIQSAGGNGGGGSSTQDAENYLNMFEEVAEFDSKIRGLINWIRENGVVVEALLAGIGAKLLGLSFPAAITISGIVWSFEAGKENGAAGDTILKSLEDDIGGILLGALGGAGIGFSLMPPGQKLKGALVGFLVGAAIGIFAHILGWQQGDEETVFDGKLFGYNLRQTLTSVLSFGALGAAMGLAFVGFKGALVGFTIGATVGMYLSAVNYAQGQEGEIDFEQTTFEKYLGSHIADVFATASAGLIIGAKYGGLYGALIGLTVGAVVGIAIQSANYVTAKREQWRRVVEEIKKDIQEEVGNNYFGADIVAQINILKTQITKVEEARDRAIQAITAVRGGWVVAVTIGLENLTDERKAELATQVETMCTSISQYLEEQNVELQLGAGIYADPGSPAAQEFTDLIEANSEIAEVYRNIGRAIGRYLSEGTIDGYSGTVEDLMEMLENMTSNLAESQASANVVNRVIRAEGDLTGTPTQRAVALYEAYGEIEGDVRDSARATIDEKFTAAAGVIANMQALLGMNDEDFAMFAPEGYTRDMVRERLARAQAIYDSLDTVEEREAAIDAMIQRIITAGRLRYAADLADLVREAVGDDRGLYNLLYNSNPIEQRAYLSDMGFELSEEEANALIEVLRAGLGDAFRDEMQDFADIAYATSVVEDVYGYSDLSPILSELVVLLSTPEAEWGDWADELYAIVEWLNNPERGNFIEDTGGEYAYWNSLFYDNSAVEWLIDWWQSRNASGMSSGGGGAPTGYVPGGTYVGVNYGTVYGGGTAPGIDSEKEDAEEEKTNALKTTNALLQRLLGKEWTVEIKPSATFGRVAKDSEKLYASAKG